LIAPGEPVTSIAKRLKTLAERLDAALPVDRVYARREMQRIRAALGYGRKAQLLERCERLGQRLAASESVRRARRDHRPVLNFDPHLPINAKKEELIEAIGKHRVIIVAGETGSGKTTQLPKNYSG
jgi:ATP-dependent helicase HrpA